MRRTALQLPCQCSLNWTHVNATCWTEWICSSVKVSLWLIYCWKPPLTSLLKDSQESHTTGHGLGGGVGWGGDSAPVCRRVHTLDKSDHIFTSQTCPFPTSNILRHTIQITKKVVEKCCVLTVGQRSILINLYHKVYWHSDGHIYKWNNCFPACWSIIAAAVSHYWL